MCVERGCVYGECVYEECGGGYVQSVGVWTVWVVGECVGGWRLPVGADCEGVCIYRSI